MVRYNKMTMATRDQERAEVKFPPGTRVRSSRSYEVSLGGRALFGTVVPSESPHFIAVQWDHRPEPVYVAPGGLELVRNAMQTNGMREQARAAVKNHFLDQMDEEVKAWRRGALWDLYNGPIDSDQAEAEGLPQGFTYTRALRMLDDWWDRVGGTVWYDIQSGEVLTSDPTESFDEEGQPYSLPEDVFVFESGDAKRLVFGELITEGGMNPNRMKPNNVVDAIVEGMATTLWGDQWATHVEEHRCQSLSGVEITEVMPPTPPEAFTMARELVAKIEANNRKSIYALLADAATSDGVEPDAGYRRSFGSDLAFMAMGAGVSWFDDHAKFPLKVPHIEPYALHELAEEQCGQPVDSMHGPRRR